MKRKISWKIIPLMTVFLLGACQKPSLYEWGAYDDRLLDYYKDVSQLPAFEAELFSLIEQAAASEKPMPPGIFAEYGFLQMQKGDNKSAVKFFKMEKDLWPESKVLMETMIRAAGGDTMDDQKQTADTAAQNKG